MIVARPGTMEEYNRYRGTVVGWGFLPEPERCGEPPLEEWRRCVGDAHRCGMRFQGRVELEADWRGMIDYDHNLMDSVCRDLDGGAITTWWTHTHRGHPAYYFCTNAPGYRVYLMHQVRRVMAAGADLLMID